MTPHNQVEQVEHHEKRETDFTDFQSPHEASVKRLIDAVDRAYHHPWHMAWRSFWQGFMAAIGAAVGSIVFIVLASYIFIAMGGQEYLQKSIKSLQDSIIPEDLKNLSTEINSTGRNLPSTDDIQNLQKQLDEMNSANISDSVN